MAKRGKSRSPGYVSGSHWSNCYSCGFAFRKEDLKLTWDNRWVDEDCWEQRHPQDFLRVLEEKVAAEQPILHDDTNNLQPGETLGPVITQAPTFGSTTSVANRGEADRMVCNSRDIPEATFGGQTMTDPERV